jgi:hypothetical protein
MMNPFQDTSAYRKKPKPILDKDIEVTPIKVYSESELKNQRPWKWDKVSKITSSEFESLKRNENKEIDNKIAKVIKAKSEYLLSPLYQQRASKFKNPFVNPEAFPSRKLVNLNPDSDINEIAHEFGHMTGARPGSTPGTAMVLNFQEQAEIMKRNKHVQKISREIGRPILTDRQLPFEIDRTNTHKFSPWENKADIEGMRFILYNNGITKKYGDPLTPEQFKKALENPKIKKTLQIERLRNNFEDNDIIQLNNILAANMQQNQNIA